MNSLIISILFLIPFILGETPQGQTPLVIGGEAARKGEFPYLVSLFLNSGFRCGGTLVSNNSVLTAAHCLIDGTTFAQIPPSQFFVIAGDHNVLNNFESTDQLQRVRNYEIHPNFRRNDSYFHHDNIALLFTNASFDMNNFVQAAPLKRATAGLNTGTTVGWGLYEEGGQHISTTPMKVVLSIRPNNSCSEKFGRNGFNPEVQFCAGIENKGACAADNGGPFVVGNNRDLYAIMSYSQRNNCATTPTGSVFQRIGPYLDWLQENIEKNPPFNPNDPGNGNGNGSGMVFRVQLGTLLFLAFLAVINKFL